MTERLLVLLTCVLIAIRIRPRPLALDRDVPVQPDPATAAHQHRRGARRRLRPRRPPTLGPQQVALWCEALSRAARSGSSVPAAITTVQGDPAVRQHTAAMVLALSRGVSLADSVSQVKRHPDIDVAMAVIAAHARHGGKAAEPLDRAAAILRGRAADAAERRVHSTQARMSAQVMTVLPVAVLAVLLATSSATRSALAQPAGIALVTFGGVLNLTGWWWMRQIIDRASR